VERIHSLQKGCHGINLACRVRLVAYVSPLMLVRSLNWRVCRYPSKGGTILPKVAFLATVVALTISLHARAGVPQVWASTYVALYPALLGRETPRPLGLMVGSVIRPPTLIMPRFGPIWSTNPLRLMWLLWSLAFHLTFHLLYHSGLLHQSDKVLDGQKSHHQPDITA